MKTLYSWIMPWWRLYHFSELLLENSAPKPSSYVESVPGGLLNAEKESLGTRNFFAHLVRFDLQ